MSLLATRYSPYWGSLHTDQGSMWPSLDTWEHRDHYHYSSLSQGCHHHHLVMIVSLAAEVPGAPVLPLTSPLINVLVNINSTKVTCHCHLYRNLKWEYPQIMDIRYVMKEVHTSHRQVQLNVCFLLPMLSAVLLVVCLLLLWIGENN